MRAIRRLYFYAVSLISIEVVVWGIIGLLRNIFNLLPGGTTGVLASGLALILVGLPIFLLHWGIAQREAYHDDEERSSRIRALFFYGALLALLIPVVQSALAIVNRLLLVVLSQSPAQAVVGSSQSSTDNLIAIAVNLLVLIYFYRVLQKDWRDNLPGNELADVRRLYRYIWVIYGLILLVPGVRLVLTFILYRPEGLQNTAAVSLGNGVALIIVGAPLFAVTWLAVQHSLADPQEKRSLLRLVLLYLITLVSVVTTLVQAGVLLASVLRQALGEGLAFNLWLNKHSGDIATLIPFAVMWAYFSAQLEREMQAMPDEPRRAAPRRLYNYILALLGNLTTFFGVQLLLALIVEVWLGDVRGADALRAALANGIAALATGIPLWLTAWGRMQAEAAQLSAEGDHARRSLVRKSYLYLLLFLTVVGGMSSAGWLFYLIFTNLLGSLTATFARDSVMWLFALLQVLVWLLYHLHSLRADNALEQRLLGERHARFPALILQDGSEVFTDELVHALHRIAPRLPVAVQRVADGVPMDDARTAGVVILPAGLALQPGEALRLWLEDFKGRRLVLPQAVEGWVWLGSVPRSPRDLARETALAVRQMAEGQDISSASPHSPWSVVGYVLGAIFGLILLFFLVLLVISSMR